MYVGNTQDGSGLHHLIWEVVGNVIDLHLRREASELGSEASVCGEPGDEASTPPVSFDMRPGRPRAST